MPGLVRADWGSKLSIISKVNVYKLPLPMWWLIRRHY
jgi:hypothetical protein